MDEQSVKVADGYKKTELGAIPDNWNIVKLSEHVEKFIVPMRDKPKQFDGEVSWCRIEDFDGKYLYTSKSGKLVSKETISEMNLRINPVGTVLCSCSARLGICAIVGKPLITNQTFIGLVPSKSLDTEFLYYLMESYASRLQALSTGTTLAYLPRSRFESFNVVFPPLPEQQKIASILSKIDEQISQTEAIIEKTEDLKKGLMQQLLTKGIGRTRFKKTEIGEIPEEWEINKIGDVCHINKESLSSSTPEDYVIKYIDISSIEYTGCKPKTKTLKFKDAPSRARRVVKSSNIIISTVRPNLRGFTYIGNADSNLICSTGFAVLECKNSVSPKFVYQFVLSNIFMNQILKRLVGSNYPAINNDDMENVKISLPDTLDEQHKIASILSQVDDQITHNKNYLSKLKELKKGLMQDLLTGKVRVKMI